jgi:hypothetical protein
MDLGAALALARKAFDKDHRNKMSRQALGKHMGHENLSGPALTKIGALRAYGLIEGSGDELRISQDGVTAMMAPAAAPERKQALNRLAFRPALFQKISKEFPGPVSEDNLRFWLIKRQFTTEAAAKATKSYLATMRLVNEGGTPYTEPLAGEEDDHANPEIEVEVGDLVQVEIGGQFQLEKPRRVRAIREHEGQKWVFIDGEKTGIPMSQAVVEQKGSSVPAAAGTLVPPILQEERPELKPGMKEEKNSLDEGEAVLIWPENLSKDSVRDLEYWLQGVLRKARRRAGLPEQEGGPAKKEG